MKHGYTHIQVLLDRSGSMDNIKDDTEGGLATFIKDQQVFDAGECTFGLHQFDDVFEVVIPPTDIKTVERPVLVPRGSTALYDAIVNSIAKTGRWLSMMTEDERPSTVLFVIVTDGEENSSREYTQEQAFKVISEQTDQWKWIFHFLAANQDAFLAGGRLGVNAGSTMTYAATSHGTRSAYAGLSTNTSRVRGASASGGDVLAASTYTEEERDASST